MGGSIALRTALVAGSLLAASAAGVALAQDALPPGDVDFTDSQNAFRPQERAIDVSVREDGARFAPVDPNDGGEGEPNRRLELELAAGGGDSPVDVSIAQRASLGANAEGDIDRSGSGSELRVGRGIVDRREGSGDNTVYMFVASDNEALTWQPGTRSEFGGQGSSVALQDRVEVGDLSAGVTYERNGIQASLAYVEREESTRVGQQSFSQDESFTGLTVTMRR
ncbi:MAG: hypothetical protein AB7O98_01130 [Hyphomonadaceae bacterium]